MEFGLLRVKSLQMSKLDVNVDPDDLIKLCMKAIHEIHPDDLAYLFATGKSELEIRNQIALYMHRNRGMGQVVSREWNRHDLVVLENGVPKLIMEGKSWIHADAANPKKLNIGEKSISHGMRKDLKKIKETSKKYGEVNAYISFVLFTVDVTVKTKKEIKDASIKYANAHLKAIKSKIIDSGGGGGRGALSEFLHDYGVIKRHPIDVGKYMGCKVAADFFILKPLPRLLK